MTEIRRDADVDLDALDLLVVGAGPTGLAIGAAAQAAGLSSLILDRGGLTQAIYEFPDFMRFFTTRDLLEIADVPFAIPDEKPDRRQALVYYRAVAAHHRLRLALHEDVLAVVPDAGGFRVESRARVTGRRRERRAAAVAFATGYFGNPRRLGVPGEDESWVERRYRDPYRSFGAEVVVVGGGNSAAEAALELHRAGVRVTVVVRAASLKPTIKYWVRPDFENRVAEGSIRARYETRVTAFTERGVEIRGPQGEETLPARHALVLVGYEPEMELLRGAGIDIDPGSLVPRVDPSTCESNVSGLYVAGTLQAGKDTGKIFIENSRDHGPKIARHLAGRLAR
jgi:thioredoxin reductase (NADPH)